MMAGAPRTKNWKANEIPDFIGRRYLLVVNGEVQVTATNQTPKLTVHTPQGINPRILLLDLSIVSSGGIGGPIVFFKSVHFTRPTSGHQYDEVDILFDGKVIARIKVGHPRSVAAAATKKKRAKK
jgi:hypothetical protein